MVSSAISLASSTSWAMSLPTVRTAYYVGHQPTTAFGNAFLTDRTVFSLLDIKNTLLPLDADTIRTAYDSVLWAPRLPTGAELDTLKQQLQGHVHLLVPDVQDLAPRMPGEMRRLTVHVLVRAFQLLEEYADGSPACDAFDLATMARAPRPAWEADRSGRDRRGDPSALVRRLPATDRRRRAVRATHVRQ
nr:DUF6415 family natural product biosynthesis protein [Streptomyces chartreusis]